MARRLTLDEFRRRLGTVGKDLDKVVLPPFRKGYSQCRKELVSSYKKHELGQKIWRWRKRKFGLRSGPIVGTSKKSGGFRPRWSRSNMDWRAQFGVPGFTGKIEEGGRLRRHVIFNKKTVKPGHIVRRMPILDQVVSKHWDRVTRDVSTALRNYLNRAL